MTEEELKQDYDIILAGWRLLKEYHDIGQGKEADSRWEAVTKQADSIYKKYGTEFARAIALDIVLELERRSRQRKEVKK